MCYVEDAAWHAALADPPIIGRLSPHTADPIKVVGITGKKRSGKTTVSNLMRDHLTSFHGLTVEQANMSDPLHEMLLRINPWIEVTIWEALNAKRTLPNFVRYRELTDDYGYENAKDLFSAYREALQETGTEGIRYEDPDFWVKAVQRRIARSKADVYIVSAIRFPNELAVRPDLLFHTVNLTDDGSDTHESELQIASVLSQARAQGIPTWRLDNLEDMPYYVRIASNELLWR